MSDNYKWSTTKPSLKEFADLLNFYIKECIDISLEQEPKESYHGVFTPASVNVSIIDSNGDYRELRIVDIEIDRLMGCSCGVGLSIIVKDEIDDSVAEQREREEKLIRGCFEFCNTPQPTERQLSLIYEDAGLEKLI